MKHFLMVLLAGAVAGMTSPFVAKSIVYIITTLNRLWGAYIVFAPLIGFWIVGYLYRYSKLILGTGVNSYKDENIRIKIHDLALKYLSTSVTLGFGGSGGLVSPILFMGKGISEIFIRKGEKIFSIALASGMLTYYLGTPLSAALLSVEYFEKDRVGYEEIMPAILSSMISYYIYDLMGFQPLLLNAIAVMKIPKVHFSDIFASYLLGAVVGGIGMIMYLLKWLYKNFMDRLRPLHKTIASGVVVSLVGIIFGNDILGLKIIYGETAYRFVPGKILATVFTIESMGSCGYFTPLTIIGMNLGYIFQNIGITQEIGSVVGISALLSSMLNVPIAAILFPVELFGYGALIPSAIGSSMAYMLYKRFRLE